MLENILVFSGHNVVSEWNSNCFLVLKCHSCRERLESSQPYERLLFSTKVRCCTIPIRGRKFSTQVGAKIAVSLIPSSFYVVALFSHPSFSFLRERDFFSSEGRSCCWRVRNSPCEASSFFPPHPAISHRKREEKPGERAKIPWESERKESGGSLTVLF